MKIILGSMNQAKKRAVHTVFPEATIVTDAIPSYVRKQPMTDEETRKGAINRAIGAANKQQDHFGIGLEGGIMFIDSDLYLCNWGAICTPSKKVYAAAGGRLKLPNTFTSFLENGMELSDVMDNFVMKSNIRHHEGTVGIFTKGIVQRSDLFEHVLLLLKGQLAYDGEISSEPPNN